MSAPGPSWLGPTRPTECRSNSRRGLISQHYLPHRTGKHNPDADKAQTSHVSHQVLGEQCCCGVQRRTRGTNFYTASGWHCEVQPRQHSEPSGSGRAVVLQWMHHPHKALIPFHQYRCAHRLSQLPHRHRQDATNRIAFISQPRRHQRGRRVLQAKAEKRSSAQPINPHPVGGP